MQIKPRSGDEADVRQRTEYEDARSRGREESVMEPIAALQYRLELWWWGRDRG